MERKSGNDVRRKIRFTYTRVTGANSAQIFQVNKNSRLKVDSSFKCL